MDTATEIERRSLLSALVGRDRVIAVVGAGGKKTTMYALASAFSGRVALSSTSHMYPYDRRYVDAVITLDDGTPETVESAHARVVAFCSRTDTPKRIGGLSPERVTSLATDRSFDVLLLKADGARARLIKAPAPYEPIIPEVVERVIYLVSARAIGRPLDGAVAHRPERLAAVVNAVVGEPITPAHVARLIASEHGGMKGAGRAPVVPVINAVDDEAVRALAHEAAQAALSLSNRFDRVVLASMQVPRIVDVVSR